MPKILINETDRTSPGTPDSYANYAVLLAGFTGRTPVLTEDATESTVADKIQPDSNGIYEFASAQDFIDTIGLCGPEKSITVQGGAERVERHYGNQMAYELLNLGYTIIYKPINSIIDMNTETFWEVFKDKANYDFRFVTHGLLESSEMSTTDLEAYNTAEERLEIVNKAAELLEDIENSVSVDLATNTSLEIEEAKVAEYNKLIVDDTKKEYFKKSNGELYADYFAACEGVAAESATLTTEMRIFENTYITTSIINKINGHIAKLARYTKDDPELIPGRGDCIALIELDERTYNSTSSDQAASLIIEAINSMSQINDDNGKYCALTVPSVYYKMEDDASFDNNKKFPGAFHYLACFISSLKSGFAEWYAAAGYTRGVSSYVIDKTTVKLGEIAINALEPRNIVNQSTEPKFACNVIANFRGSYYLWGNRTAEKLGAKAGGNDLIASHFLNIRQLCTTIKKQLYVACRRFTFDPNSDTLWINFTNAIKPTLEAMKADQGIRDYKILKVFTDKKATLKAKIRIIPIEAVEDFDLEVSLEDSFGETAAVVTE